MAKDLAIILNNGTLNSAVTTALAAQKFRPIMIYAETSLAPAARARAAYDQQVGHFKPYREHTLAMGFLSTLPAAQASTSADPRQTALLAPELLRLLPVVAAAMPFAAHYQVSAIYLGLRTGPDTETLAQATEYLQILAELIQLPCGQPEIEIVAPLLELEPWQVVDVGYQVGAPLEKTWTCSEQTAEPCGSCAGCRTRQAAFMQAARPDPMRPPKRG